MPPATISPINSHPVLPSSAYDIPLVTAPAKRHIPMPIKSAVIGKCPSGSENIIGLFKQ